MQHKRRIFVKVEASLNVEGRKPLKMEEGSKRVQGCLNREEKTMCERGLWKEGVNDGREGKRDKGGEGAKKVFIKNIY